MNPRLFNLISALITCLILMSCGNFTLDNPPSANAANRRLYVNDQAPADSLIPAIVRDGIKFALQPSKAYQLSITTARTKDRLKVYYYSESRGVQGEFISLEATSNGTEEIFPLTSDQSAAQFFVAQLITPEGKSAAGSLGHISLASGPPLATDTFNLRLVFVRTLKNLPDAASKKNFADSLFYYIAQVYEPYGIAIRGSYEIVEPTSPHEVLPFGNSFITLPGTRITNNAHLYLVDSIAIADTGLGLLGVVLGFAPREVVDLDMHRESRVILANRAQPNRLAITAAHELGHFFGLRHTVATEHDLLQDDDFSNYEDGFTDTRFCGIAKVAASFHEYSRNGKDLPFDKKFPEDDSHFIPIKGGTVYCLRMYRPIDPSCNGFQCDIRNLMHPNECAGATQTQLSLQQVTFLKKNLAAYKH